MSKCFMLTIAFCLITSNAFGQGEYRSIDFEYCETVLGLYGSGSPPIVPANDDTRAFSGTYSLMLEDNSDTGTPQALIAWITGLSDGEEITASFWRYDDTPGASPSCRIWAHWNDDPSDLYGYNGSASGNTDYGPGTGWDQTSYTWINTDGHTGIVIECRTYSNPGDIVWIDDIEVSTSGTGSIRMAPADIDLAITDITYTVEGDSIFIQPQGNYTTTSCRQELTAVVTYYLELDPVAEYSIDFGMIDQEPMFLCRYDTWPTCDMGDCPVMVVNGVPMQTFCLPGVEEGPYGIYYLICECQGQLFSAAAGPFAIEEQSTISVRIDILDDFDELVLDNNEMTIPIEPTAVIEPNAVTPVNWSIIKNVYR